MNTPSILEAQARIDHEIAELLHTIFDPHAPQIRSLRTRRNMLSPVSRLPFETLSTIFIHCARSYYEFSRHNDVRPMPNWVNISYVCDQWRRVALNTPILWIFISGTSPRWTQELLLRSKQAPLRIRFERFEIASCSAVQRSLESVLAHTARIQELTLRLPFCVLETLPILRSPAPLLQSLTIYVPETGPPNNTQLVTLFNGVTPALRHLELDHWAILPSISVLDRLTTLTLHDLPRLSTIADLQVILSSAQSLVDLEIRSLTSDDIHPTIGSANIQLPHLSRLVIHDSLSAIIQILACIDIPLQASITITWSRMGTTPQVWTSLRSFLKKRFSAVGDHPSIRIRTLMVLITSDADFRIVFGASGNHGRPTLRLEDWYDTSGAVVPLRIGWWVSEQRSPQGVIDIIQDAHSSGFLAGLQHTHVRFDATVATTTPHTCFENVFGAIPELRSIEATGTALNLRCLCAFLSFTPHDPTGNTSVEKFSDLTKFPPALEELVISWTRFAHEALPPPTDGGQHTASISDLYEALARRKEKGLPLRRLILYGCSHVLKEVVDQLATVVKEVVWYGVAE